MKDSANMGKSRQPAMMLLVPLGVGAVVSLILLMLCAMLMTFQDIPPSVTKPLASICGGAGALAGGFSAARKIGQRGMLMGIAVGGLLFLLITIVGFIVGPTAVTAFTVMKLVIMLLGGAIGGILGINLGAKRRFLR